MILNKLKTMLSKKPNHNPTKLVTELDLTIRTQNILRRAGIEIVGDLVTLARKDIKSYRGSNRKTVEEVENVLGGMGLKLREGEK